MMGLPNIKLIGYGIVAAVLAGLGGYIWYLHHTVSTQRDTITLQQTALTSANTETEAANANTAKLSILLDKQAAQFKQMQQRAAAIARVAAERQRQIAQLLASRPSPALADELSARLRSALERIQGHGFDSTAGASYSAASGDAAYCLDSSSTEALIADVSACADWMDSVDTDRSAGHSGGGKKMSGADIPP